MAKVFMSCKKYLHQMHKNRNGTGAPQTGINRTGLGEGGGGRREGNEGGARMISLQVVKAEGS